MNEWLLVPVMALFVVYGIWLMRRLDSFLNAGKTTGSHKRRH